MNIIDLLASEQRIYEESVRNREATFYGIPRKRFRWSSFRFEWGRVCWVVHPWAEQDYYWWVWETPQ